MNASHWQHLCSSKQHTAFRSSVTEYLQHAEKNVLQLSEAKKLAEGIYDYTLACQLARIIDQTEPSVQSRVSLIESLVRIGRTIRSVKGFTDRKSRSNWLFG